MFKNVLLLNGSQKLTQFLALISIAFCIMPLKTHAAEPSWQGVWNGTIGKSKVIVCLSSNGSSAYRYLRYQTDIPLSLHGKDWEESVGGAVSGVWTLSDAQGDSLDGNWQNSKTHLILPIFLKRVTGIYSSNLCESNVYKSGITEKTSVSNAFVNTTSNDANQPEFVYIANHEDHTISAYRSNPATGTLTSVLGSPFKVGDYPLNIVVNTAGSFAYVLNSANGRLEKSGEYAYDSISAYRINPVTGVLTAIAGKPLKTGIGSISAAIDPTGTFVYVANNGDGVGLSSNSSSISIFRIDTTSGALTPVRKNSLRIDYHPLNITVSKTGLFAYVTYEGHDYWSLQNDGIEVFLINNTTGDLTPIRDDSLNIDGTPIFLTIHQSGKFAYLAFNGNDSNNSNGVIFYRINASTGKLSEIGSLKIKDSVNSIAINSLGSFVYVITDVATYAYRISSDLGTLRRVEGSPFKNVNQEVLGQNRNITINSAGTCIYETTSEGALLVFKVDISTGVISPLEGTFVTGRDPVSIVLVHP